MTEASSSSNSASRRVATCLSRCREWGRGWDRDGAWEDGERRTHALYPILVTPLTTRPLENGAKGTERGP